jgi:transposase
MIEKLRLQGINSGRIILDNASIHKSSDLCTLFTGFGIELCFLPAYSPQLNPIEDVFSKWKYYIKTMNPNTIEELNIAVARASSLIHEVIVKISILMCEVLC